MLHVCLVADDIPILGSHGIQKLPRLAKDGHDHSTKVYLEVGEEILVIIIELATGNLHLRLPPNGVDGCWE